MKDQRDTLIQEAAVRLGISEYQLRRRLMEIGFTGIRKVQRNRTGKPW